MFYIDNLIIPKLQERFDTLHEYGSQVAFLLQLLDYELNFPDMEAEISRYCKEQCNEVYDMAKLHRVLTDKTFIHNYAKSVNSIKKVKFLINTLCSDLLDEMGEYDEIIQKANDEIAVFQDIEGMEFMGDTSEKKIRKTGNSINRVLAMKEKAGG